MRDTKLKWGLGGVFELTQNYMTNLQINDTAWHASCGTKEVKITCPICFGKLKVILILGDDEWVETPCDFCGKGYSDPLGYINEYQWIAEPRTIVISGVSREETREGCKVTYQTYDNYNIDSDEIFATKEEAMIRCNEKIAERGEEERKRIEWGKEDNKKS